MTHGSPSSEVPEQRQRYLDAVCDAGAPLELGLKVDRRAFLQQYYAQAELDELAQDPRRLAAGAFGHLALARKRERGTAKVRVFNPTQQRDGFTSKHTIIETVNDDMPFLVDSLSMTLTSMGRAIHSTIHPLLPIERSAKGELLAVCAAGGDVTTTESFIHLEIVRETDTEILAGIESALRSTLRDVRVAVEDWAKMLDNLRSATAQLRATPGLPPDLQAESVALLEWLARDHFTLLGYREYELIRGRSVDTLRTRPRTGLGLLRGEPSKEAAAVELSGRAREEARSSNPLVITKSNKRSTVHRPALLDHIGVKVFDDRGRPVAERRFLGLFTSAAYSQNPRTIPLLKFKIRRVLEESGLDLHSHRGKTLQHVLDTLPRDDLFQASPEELSTIGYRVLGLQERHRVKLFCRRETFGRYYSCLVYLPRDQYSARAQRAIESILLTGLDGTAVESELTMSESALARLTVTVRATPGRATDPDMAALQSQVENAVRTWHDRLREALLAQLPEDRALKLLRNFGEHFSLAYQEDADASRASDDIQQVALVHEGASDLRVSLARSRVDRPERLRLTTFKRDEPIQLYVALPILENFGFKVVSERVYPVRLATNPVWVQDFELETADQRALDPATLDERFRECFALVLRGQVENDGFNGFVVSAGFDWRESVLLRALCKYVSQTRIPYSQAYMQEVLGRYPRYARALVDRFASLFEVDLAADGRDELLATAEPLLKSELDRTASLDDDRTLRAFGSVVNAVLRTNYYQRDDAGRPKSYISFKLDPTAVPELPKPRPMFEIFVYSQHVEGVHLRASRIARGGLRWSDRREDYRTEVLGLMKAQQVKNTVIVPNGAKGGFVCKALPSGDRQAIQREVVACYQTFIRGLLDVTDNIVGGRVRPPGRALRRDADDPYLVVAADKGTAAFSDIANAVAAEYRFWLGDAFASGGSAGYDHKKIAITARGAWEAVKRHFREIGIDPRKQDFTVIGIGDMSGDVFGNGMLLSPHIKLVAAFNHQHIFIDPDPDPAASLVERRRLFDLPRSTWDDYDRRTMSTGGGVYSRSSKSIELTGEAQALLDLSATAVSPPELIRAILAARVDLLWNGGIGTYVKAGAESHGEAGDPANDAVRVNAAELRCRVVGEGGNLGLTQRGRIEYALRGGRLNTDFIDNSGGVDSSDREVNIKILLEEAIRRKQLPRGKRNALLAAMTKEVVALVLGSNYAQTQALSMMDSRAAERLGEHARLIKVLEAQGLLDRALEFLPTEDQIEERRASGTGLARPELAIILSYSKIELIDSLVRTGIPEDRFLASELEAYFPRALSTRFGPLLRKHPLAREIIAMLVGGSIINRMGPFFVLRAEEETGADVAQVARAYAVVREVFGVRKLWREIEALDYSVAAKVQYDSIFQISRMVRRAVYWLLQNYEQELDIESVVKRFKPGAQQALAALPVLVSGRSAERFQQAGRDFEGAGLPAGCARHIASLGLMTQMFDIIELALEFRLAVPEIGRLYFALAKELRLDLVREQLEALKVDGRWRAMARAALLETLAQEQRALLRSALSGRRGRKPDEALAAWLKRHQARIARAQRALDDMHMAGSMDFATLSVALKEVGRLV
jgi:glutamate dehydrogenase